LSTCRRLRFEIARKDARAPASLAFSTKPRASARSGECSCSWSSMTIRYGGMPLAKCCVGRRGESGKTDRLGRSAHEATAYTGPFPVIAHHAHLMPARAMAHQEDARRVAPTCRDVHPDPGKCGGHIGRLRWPDVAGAQPITDRSRGHTRCLECFGHRRIGRALPACGLNTGQADAMDEDEGCKPGSRRRLKSELLAGAASIGIKECRRYRVRAGYAQPRQSKTRRSRSTYSA